MYRDGVGVFEPSQHFGGIYRYSALKVYGHVLGKAVYRADDSDIAVENSAALFIVFVHSTS